MPFTAHDPRVFYEAIITQLASSTGKNIGKAEAPTTLTDPYAVVYPGDEDDLDWNLADLNDLTYFNWQVTSVGSTMDQTLWMQQKVRAALLGWQPTVAGITCGAVLRDGGQGLRRDDKVQPPKFYSVDLFTVLAD